MAGAPETGGGSPPPVGEAAQPSLPLWAAILLVLSGVFLIIVETPNLLFFLGVVLVLVGVYVLLVRRRPN